MFSFKPVSEEEIQRANLLEKGEYKFYVKAATQKTSKAGNPMVEIVLSIHDQNNREHLVYDYLMDIESLRYKIRHFCYSIGLGDKYELGEVNPLSFVDKIGYAKIYIKDDPSGQYKPKNAVTDYMNGPTKDNVVKMDVKQTVEAPFFNDDLPF